MVASRIEDDADVKEVLQKMGELSAEKRNWIAQELLRQRDDESDMMTDEWLAKIRARIDRAERGEGESVPGTEARARLREHLAKRRR